MKGKAKKQAVKKRIAIRHTYMHKCRAMRFEIIQAEFRAKLMNAMVRYYSRLAPSPFETMLCKGLFTTTIKEQLIQV